MNNALTDALGYAGSVIEKPGRAVRGVMAGKLREGLAAVPFSDSLGLTDEHDRTSGRDLLDQYGVTSKHDKGWGAWGAGMAADTLTDPLAWMGAGAAFKAAPTLSRGLTAGAKSLSGLDLLDTLKAGGKGVGHFLNNEDGTLKPFVGDWGNGLDHGPTDSLHQHLPFGQDAKATSAQKELAYAAGPKYPGGIEKLAAALQGNDFGGARRLLNHPNAARIAEEIPEGTQFLGNGAEAVAFRSPEGHVIRVAPAMSQFGSAGRADIPEIIQPFRSQLIHAYDAAGQKSNPWMVEHLPEVLPFEITQGERDQFRRITEGMSRAHGPEEAGALSAGAAAAKRRVTEAKYDLTPSLANIVHSKYAHLDPWDFHEGNTALTSEGRVIGHDGGMVRARDKAWPITRYSPSDQIDPNDLETILKMGGPEEVRRVIDEGRTLGSAGQGIVPGGYSSREIKGLASDRRAWNEFLAGNAHYGESHDPYSVPGVRGFVSSTDKPRAPASFTLGNNPVQGTDEALTTALHGGETPGDAFDLRGLWNTENRNLIAQASPTFAADNMSALGRLAARGELPKAELQDYIADAFAKLAKQHEYAGATASRAGSF